MPSEPAPAAPRPTAGRLVLSRKVNQTILIGDDVEITVARVDLGSVRLAVKAPRDLHVRRAELPSPPDPA